MSAKPWKFRLATEADIPAIHKLVNSAYRGDSSRRGWTTEAHLLEGQRTDPVQLKIMLDDPISFLHVVEITEDGYLPGVNKYDLVACVEIRKESDGLYIGMLTVNPWIQNSGIGKWVLEQCEEIALSWGYQRVYMTVITLRADLMNWYERRGYNRTGNVLPFHTDPSFGVPLQPLQLETLEKFLNSKK
ncbi:MAG: GNAT family N-acetyltransferase [Bdellovibrionota bacterium]